MTPLLLASLLSVHYRIDATLDPRARRLQGRVSIDLRVDGGAPRSEVWLWLLPNRLGRPPEGLDELTYHWVYPREFDAAEMRVLETRVEGTVVVPQQVDHPKAGPRTLLRVALPRPLVPGATVRLDLRYEAAIPRRYGPFGCVHGVCTLMQGWHPMVASGEGAGPGDEGMPARGDYDVTVRSPWATVLDGEIAATVAARDALYVTLVAMKKLRDLEEEHRGVHIRYVSRFKEPPASRKRVPYGVESYYRLGVDAARQAIDLLADLGLPLPESVTLCEAPLRHEIAAPHGGVVLVSDRAWRLLPLERFRKFHTFQVARALFAGAIEERSRAFEDARDLAWTPDVGATFLVELLALRQYGRVEFARDVLRYFSFVPDVDSLLYAPKVAFSSAYFGAVEEPDRLRDDLRRFNNDLPRGKRIYEKLKDLLDGASLVAAMRATLRDGVPLRVAATRAAGRPLDEFFAQWLGRYPFVSYQMMGVESAAEAEGYAHRIRVRKHGNVVEPVTLWARDESGVERTLRWDGRGREHEFRFRSREPLDVVHLDAKERLVEDWPDRKDDLRFDNRVPARWKLLLVRLDGYVDVPEREIGFVADLTLRRVYDLRNSIRFALFRSAATRLGAGVGATRAFGDRVDDNRLSSAAGIFTTASRMDDRFALAPGQEPRPGTRVSFSAGVGHDDRFWLLDPDQGWGLGAGMGTQGTLLDDGERLWTGSASLAGTAVVRAAPGHTLAAHLSAAGVGGEIQLHSQLVSLGGPGGMIGYQSDELLGRAAAVLALEYRHMFVRGLDWNVLHLARGRSIGGALFANAASLSSCESLGAGWFGGDSGFVDAGYSVRAYFDQLGVSPAIFRADIGVPLTRRSRTCTVGGATIDSADAKRPPVGFVLSFAPPF